MLNFSNLAEITLGATGDPVAFFDSAGKLLIETNGIFRNPQEMKRSKSKSMRLMDCDTVKVPSTAKVKKGMIFYFGGVRYQVSDRPIRDTSGGLICKLSTVISDSGKANKVKEFDLNR